MQVIEREERPMMHERERQEKPSCEDRPMTCERQRVKRPLMQEREWIDQ